ncbi:SIS domain-containing protein [Metschnikowia bicuspidata var. bicuspidata NRRL YB-4993]|uniref:SIS domain-containing protein n=1 Tax=Metschnikowia bicuspidata var. bicuspidata NRRL YB-4993 TaxID=869754 RepID=A0A1A0HHQ9_9ASCO|nr:SIS domain-containing protein [Metschnikowia bicuspidata var. bicuspidata NRRL YB-4993]OBA23417.1 SIS domain-containing protein [Metschnikowia bicuspidata var. bicuspidata NRRL YB-4993]
MSAPEWQKLTFAALQSVKMTLTRQSEALKNLANHYVENIDTQLDMINSISLLYDAHSRGGKIVCCGIGKSYKIATKTVATLKSLTINADELHPAEALHGDLGLLRENDCIIFFTASGNTPELLQLLPHISPNIPIVLLTCSKESKLASHPQITSLLYAELPEHLKETVIHGLPAPTVSATLSLVLADAVSLALGEMVEVDHMKRKKTFSMKHPGGSIGSDLSHLNDNFNRGHSLTSSQSDMPHHGSYSSLLSLDQLRECFRTTSIASSDPESVSEEPQAVKPDSSFTSALMNAGKDACYRTTRSEFLSWSELDLLKNLTLYDYVMFESELKVLATDTEKVRLMYKDVSGLPVGFTGMNDFLTIFREVEIDVASV